MGVGRGAYKFEMARLGVPIIETQARFDEAVEVLQALLTREEVSWDGQYYQFESLRNFFLFLYFYRDFNLLQQCYREFDILHY